MASKSQSSTQTKVRTNVTHAKIPKTDWTRLRHMNGKKIRASLKSDPSIHSTEDVFWKKAKVVMPSMTTAK